MYEMIHNQQREMSLKSYRKMKLKVLKEFYVELSDEEMNKLFTLKTEIEIDNFCISMIKNRLDN